MTIRMTSAGAIFTVRCPDMIEVESRNDCDNYDDRIPTYTSRNDPTPSLDDTNSSIVSDSSEEGPTVDFNSKFHCIFVV